MRTVYTEVLACNKILECHAVRSLLNNYIHEYQSRKKVLSATYYYTLRGVNLCIFVVVDDENS